MTDGEWGIGISPRRVTLSTVGLVPQIEKLMAETGSIWRSRCTRRTNELRGRIDAGQSQIFAATTARLLPLAADTTAQANHFRICACCAASTIPSSKRAQLAKLLRGIPQQSQRDSIQSPSRQRAICGRRTRNRAFPKRLARCRRADQRAPAARRRHSSGLRAAARRGTGPHAARKTPGCGSRLIRSWEHASSV